MRLTLAQERALARRWRQHGDAEALTQLVRAHLALVVRIAGEFRHAGPPMEDLIQEGNVGLTVAARRFDPGRQTRLATYATYWIRACMLEHVVRSHGPVRIGTTRAQRRIFFNLGRARRKLEHRGPVDLKALAAELDVDVAEMEAMAPRMFQHDLQLDAVGCQDHLHCLSSGRSQDWLDPEQIYASQEEQRLRWARFQEALHQLDPRERDILTARHLCEEPETLSEVGKRFGLSRERVRQLELRARSQMRKLCSDHRPPARRIWRNRPPE